MDGEICYSCYLFPVWLQSSWRTQVSQVFYVPPIEGNGTKYQVLWQPLRFFSSVQEKISMFSMYGPLPLVGCCAVSIAGTLQGHLLSQKASHKIQVLLCDEHSYSFNFSSTLHTSA